MSTRTTLRQLRDALRAALGPEGALGPDGAGLADVFERFDGEPAEAIDEHVLELRGEAGASVLVGFLSDDALAANEAGQALGYTFRPMVALVRRRSLREGEAGATGATVDAEALDDLYDAAAATLTAAGLRVLGGRALAGDTTHWIGRLLTCETTRDLIPDEAAARFA